MSIINSDGLNTNWQLNVLRGLQNVADQIQNSGNVNPSPTAPINIRPGLIISSGVAPTVINTRVYSISFASNGTAAALISFDGGATYNAIPAGTTINMDANGLNNFYAANTFGYDTQTNAGSSLIITYNE
jgi:hypothetical protein